MTDAITPEQMARWIAAQAAHSAAYCSAYSSDERPGHDPETAGIRAACEEGYRAGLAESAARIAELEASLKEVTEYFYSGGSAAQVDAMVTRAVSVIAKGCLAKQDAGLACCCTPESTADAESPA